jgi:DNA-binding Lrp family transcriptional regulator
MCDMPTAYILLNSKPDSEAGIINDIKEIMKSNSKFKYEIQGVYGVYDMVVRVECDIMEDVRNILGKIRRVDNIVSTITMLVNEEQEI